MIQAGDFHPHLSPELGVQVGQRLVHQKDSGIADDSASHGYTLLLSAGQLRRLPIQHLGQTQDLCGLIYLGLDDFLLLMTDMQTVADVFSYRHMGIQGVVLKDHGDVPVAGLHLIHALAVDIQLSLADIFQSCYHAQGCGFSAAGGTYKNNKFIVLYLQVKILHCFKSVFISFTHML